MIMIVTSKAVQMLILGRKQINRQYLMHTVDSKKQKNKKMEVNGPNLTK